MAQHNEAEEEKEMIIRLMSAAEHVILAEKRWRERIIAEAEWHSFFCLKPRRLTNGTHVAWLCYVQRRVRPEIVRDVMRMVGSNRSYQYQTFAEALGAKLPS